ncbi:hypothetical protein MGN70_009394 [Eutypa lata]|nr:hypothetical protein MGN70_009394 [Eutypa lata]
MRNHNILKKRVATAQRKLEAAKGRIEAAELRQTKEVAVQEHNLQKILSKIRTGNQDRTAITAAKQSIAMRYNPDSHLGKIDIKTFTILAQCLSIQYLRQINRTGYSILDPVLQQTDAMPLPTPFWENYHHEINKSDSNISQYYFTGL